MAQVVRKLALGVTLSLSCVACTSGGGSGFAHESPSGQFAQLSRLKSIDSSEEQLITADEFPRKSQKPKVIGEVREGSYRLIAYIQGEFCGLRVAEAENSERSLIHVTSAWPRSDSEESTPYPAGPYSFASAAGSDGSRMWASLGCSKLAMVINYSSQDHGPASDQRGDVSIKKHREDPATLDVVIGSREARARILPQV
ncbi:hypothetical protein GCM10010260_64230 [Streptomyces filipinensis]|uniref:Lipoprotein n=1 Tax=Streptomyces filipinensis TaxID=66887 RepID=A0A918IHH8_9ACTN|nr:hypothetical protein GCM10010260_64230 [Streptomyces filipinensis]